MDKLHYFVLHPDGKIYLRGKFATDDIETEVSNQKDVFAKMAWHGLTPLFDEVFPLQCHVEKKERDIAQCCECDKAIYKEDRFMRDDKNGFSTSVCPECEGESYYNLKEVTALVTFSEPEEKLWNRISRVSGYARAFDGSRTYRITFDSISIRDTIEPMLETIERLPDGYYFELTEGLNEYVAKIRKVQPSSGVEETQEELWDDAITITGVYYPSTFGRFKVIEELSKAFTITRKNK